MDAPDPSSNTPPVPAPDAPGGPVAVARQAMPPEPFCRRCGSRRDLLTGECPACAAAAGLAPADVQDGARHIASSIGLYFVLLGTLILAAVAIAMAPDHQATIEIVVGVIDGVIVAAWCAAVWRHVSPGLVQAASPRWFALAVLVAFATFTIASILVHAMVKLGIEDLDYSDPFLDAGFGWTAVILSVCVQPAIVEELAFRGVIWSTLQRSLNVREAILVSALMFMVIHLAVPSFPHLFLIGLALGYLRARSGSIYPCMLAHFMHNLLVVLSEALYPQVA